MDIRTDRPVTLRELAAACGVSVGTVSMALREDPRVKAATRTRVQEMATALGYDPSRHEMARRMVLRRYGKRAITRSIALIFRPDFYTNTYQTNLFRGILDEVTRQGFTLVTAFVDMLEDGACVSPLPPVFHQGDVDGLLVTQPPELLATLLAHLRQQAGFDGPVVNLIQRAPGCSLVLTDDRQGFRQAADHLLALGHRHLLHLCAYPERDLEARRHAGIADACRAHGLDPAAHLHRLALPWGWINPATARHDIPQHGEEHLDPRAAPLLDYLRAHPAVTAVLCQNDAAALHAWYACRKAGLSVPDDISLVGCDDTDAMLDRHGHNLLTSIRLPLVEVGMEAARLMVARVTGAEPADVERLLPTELIPRHSTGPAQVR